MEINLEELYKLQAGLDADIAEKHSVTYESTHSRRLLALIVELGELANETRCFKYWSNKGPSEKAIVMDEYADGLHFLLSLGIPLHARKYKYEIKGSGEDLTLQFHHLYQSATRLLNDYSLEAYEDCFQKYLDLAVDLGSTSEDIIDAYKSKLKVNYHRQETNY